MIEYHGLANIDIVEGNWSSGTNYDQYTQGLASGLTPTEAAKQTWTGRQAATYGFSHVIQSFTGQHTVENTHTFYFMRPKNKARL